jgi:hypothetical protein
VTDEGRQTKGKEEEKCDVEHNKTKDYEKEGGVQFPTTYVCGDWKDRLEGEGIRWGVSFRMCRREKYLFPLLQ